MREDKTLFGKTDLIIIAVLTVVAAIIAFTYLGSFDVPQTSLQGTVSDSIMVDTGSSTVDTLWVYQGIGNAALIFLSKDNLEDKWTSEMISLSNDNMYRWHIYPLKKECGRYIKVYYFTADIEIMEIAFADKEGNISNFEITNKDSKLTALLDEQHLIPANPSLLEGMYFDELYHARTALEFIRADEPYEDTHPPLGKVIISWGIKLFGMNPFGWRFMDALFSVMLIPLFYIFMLKVSKSTIWSAIGAGLFVIDGMRIVMGRIATLDTFAVFFITAAYLFMYLFFENFSEERKFCKWALPLALSGIMFGISAAVKWTGIYSGAGLFILLMIAVIKWLYKYYNNPDRATSLMITDRKVISRLLGIFATCLIFFIVLPCVIYLLSYIPFKAGLDTSDSLFKVMWDNQVYMYEYHSKLTEGHPYGSKWYEWLFNAKPVYFYLAEDLLPENMSAKIFAFGNYVIWIGGLIAISIIIIDLITEMVRKIRKSDELPIDDRLRNNYSFLLIFYLTMLVPWMFVSRVVFMYHYYGCVPAMIMMTVLLLQKNWNNGLKEVKKDGFASKLPIVISDGKLVAGRVITISFILASLITFIICYPLFTGIPVKWKIFTLL